MPIRVPDELPAVNFLREENVFVMTTSRASGQEIRPLKVLILNLMPKKIETENQFLRLLSNSPLQVDIQLLRIDSRESRNTPAEHLNNFYCNFEDIQEQNFDGLIVTGAPLGLVEFNDVAYWPQIKQVLEWSKDHVTSTLFVCWAVQAALNILYGIPKQTRTDKLSGVYEHHIRDGPSQRQCAYLCWQTDMHPLLPSLPEFPDRYNHESTLPESQHSANAVPGMNHQSHASEAHEDGEYDARKRQRVCRCGFA